MVAIIRSIWRGSKKLLRAVFSRLFGADPSQQLWTWFS